MFVLLWDGMSKCTLNRGTLSRVLKILRTLTLDVFPTWPREGHLCTKAQYALGQFLILHKVAGIVTRHKASAGGWWRIWCHTGWGVRFRWWLRGPHCHRSHPMAEDKP